MKHRHIFITVLLVGMCSIARGQTSLYWFDNNHEGAAASNVKNGTINVDADTLSPGMHTLHYLYQTAQGVQSSTYSQTFFVNKQAKGVKAEYWFDHYFDSRKQTTTVNGLITLDADTLSPGFHTLQYQQLDADGLPSSAYCHAFYVPGRTVAAKGEYWFDTDFDNRKQLALSTSAVSIDLTGLDAGLHAVHYHALSTGGIASATYTKLFWIMDESTSLCAYHYWVNDITDSIKNVRLDATATLHTLSLDVPELPLRTVSFHFELTNGTPMAYAKNTLNLVLEATDGSCPRIERDYVDYRVSEPVDATLLLPEEPQTFAKSERLKWFKVEAGKGDSLAFKASAACTMQLFSPTGGELWAASGNDAKKMSGTRADDGGTFYLAMHDVTDASATELTISYMWEAAPKPSGDVNGDNTVDVADIASVLTVMAGVEPDPVSARNADVNNDGKVDVADIATILSIMAAKARMQQVME